MAGKMAAIAEILSAFSGGVELSVAKIAKQTKASIETVRGVARMNPGLCNLTESDSIIVVHAGGASSRTGNDIRVLGKDTGTNLTDKRPSAKPKGRHTGVSTWLSGRNE